jgi:pimeloyl-ACP methyl ester carboxylesterase
VQGVFLNSTYWRHVMERLGGERRCLAPDLLGHGDMPATPGQDVSLRAEAELLDAFCEAMGLDEVDVVANDSGSAIAQIFAARHPERIRTLTLTNGDADGNYPPADFRQVVEMAKGGVFSAQREAFAADVGLLRPGFAGRVRADRCGVGRDAQGLCGPSVRDAGGDKRPGAMAHQL